MSEYRFTNETATIVVLGQMTKDMRHVLGRIAFTALLVGLFFVFAGLMDTADRDWPAVLIDVLAATVWFGMAHDSHKRARRYKPTTTHPAEEAGA